MRLAGSLGVCSKTGYYGMSSTKYSPIQKGDGDDSTSSDSGDASVPLILGGVPKESLPAGVSRHIEKRKQHSTTYVQQLLVYGTK